MSTGAWVWFRLDAARRWRSLALLTVLIAVSGATVLTAVAGAHRGESALPRLEARTLPATVEVGPFPPDADWRLLRELPGVEAVAAYADVDLRLEGIPPADLSAGYPPADAELTRTLERPVVLRGRLADPDRAGEIVVTQSFVDSYRKGVGDTVVALLPTAQEARDPQAAAAAAPSGPRVELRIVGVVRTPWLSDGPQSRGSLLPTPALLRTYRANLLGEAAWFNALVRLSDPAAGPEFRARLATAIGRSDLWFTDLHAQSLHRQRAASFEASWLQAFGIAAFLAAVVLVGQTVARYVTTSLADLRVLGPLGMTRREAVGAAVAGPVLAAAAGAGIAVVAAAVASAWFPIGSAANDEPVPGADLDPLVLGAGPVVIVLLVLAGAGGAALLALGSAHWRQAGRPSTIAATAARARLPVPIVLGTRFALEPGRGPTAVPVRPALLGAVAGVIGVMAAFTFAAGVGEAAGNPARFGQTWQLEAALGFGGQDHVPPGLLARAARDPDVAAITDVRAAVAAEARDQVPLLVYSHSPVGRPVDVVLAAGRPPASASDVVLAPESAAALDADVGDAVTVTGSGDRRRELTVSGIGFVPAGVKCTGCSHAAGAWVSDDGFDTLFDGFQFHAALIALRPGAVPDDVAARLHELAPELAGQELFAPPYPPSAVTELRQVRRFPLVLAAFLAALAGGAVGHALAVAVRRRRHDLAVLRALGMTPRQSRAVVLTQASVLALAGLVFGVPLGVAAGRVLWRAVADFTPLEYVPPVAATTLVAVTPLALLAANLLAAWPGRRAARLNVAQVLKAE